MFGKLNFFFHILLSLPRTVYFNFRVLKFSQAIRLPFLLLGRTTFIELARVVQIDSTLCPFMVVFGAKGTKQINTPPYSIINISKNSYLEFKGNCSFSRGLSLDCSNGKIIFGKNFNSNRNCMISSDSMITFGDNVLLGDNVIIRDNDGHKVFYEGKQKDNIKPISIGNHVWIASHVIVLKGTVVADDCVIGCNSLLAKPFKDNNCLIAGNPAKVIQEHIEWRK